MYSSSPRKTFLTNRRQIRWGIVGILLLFVFTSVFNFPEWLNQGIRSINERIPITLPSIQEYFPFRLGLDLVGGTHLVYRVDTAWVTEKVEEAVEGARDVIERRVNAFGVSEPLVQTNRSGNAWNIIVDLAGVKEVQEAIRLIGETPLLEFKELDPEAEKKAEQALTDEQKAELDKRNAEIKNQATGILGRLAKGESMDVIKKDLQPQQFATRTVTKNDSVLYPWAEKADIGGVTPQVIEIPQGFIVAKLDEKRDGQPQVHASHLLICFEGISGCTTGRTRDQARAQIDELRKSATPQNFADLAKKNSIDPSAERGGDLGTFGRGVMVKEFEDVVFAQTVGTISDVVETQFGFHLIHKLEESIASEFVVSQIAFPKLTAADIRPVDPWLPAELSGRHLTRSVVQFNQNTGEVQVGLEFNAEGKELFAQITERSIGKPVAIFLDGTPISTPTVQQKITEGNAVITGNFTVKDAKQLSQRLNAGALPLPIELVGQQTVGASLGAVSLAKSLRAGLLGFILVVLFMIGCYRLPGVLASIALVLYTGMILSLFKFIPVTLTLAGIAGVILSIGMAVDANILIFERMKEELRAGKSLALAIEEGFARAWTSIRDSNVSTLISSAFLIWFGSSMVKGFALTLAIGVLVSMFSAIVITRVLLRFVLPWTKREWLILGALKRTPSKDS